MIFIPSAVLGLLSVVFLLIAQPLLSFGLLLASSSAYFYAFQRAFVRRSAVDDVWSQVAKLNTRQQQLKLGWQDHQRKLDSLSSRIVAAESGKQQRFSPFGS